ncbi:MAG: hypothetical protein IPJ77_02865 [Planctomycetes bacterium]|nr:hypothetical protein [Planctomycetota bacterium]
MSSLLRSASLLLASVLALPALANAQRLEPASSARGLRPIPIELSGPGAGTIVLPGSVPGALRAILADARGEVALQLEAEVIPYSFLLEHNPAGAIQGGLYTIVAPESVDEPVLLAEVVGEWGIDDEGYGLLTGLFLRPAAGAEPQIAGVLEGGFRVDYHVPAEIAPPFYAERPVDVPASAVSVVRAGSAHAASVELNPEHPPLPLQQPGAVSERRAADVAPDAPRIVVDTMAPQLVGRIRLLWTLYL